MSIALQSKELLTIQEDGTYAAYQTGDDLGSVYVHVTLDNGYDCYVSGWWQPDQITSEIGNIVTKANLEAELVAQQAQALQAIVNG